MAHPGRILEQAQDDATLLAVRAMEQAGVDVITDGEARREATRIALLRPWTASIRLRLAPRWGGVDRLSLSPEWLAPFGARTLYRCAMSPFYAVTRSAYQVTIPGPFTMSQQAQNDYYRDEESMALAYAEAVHEEIRAVCSRGRCSTAR